MATDVLKQVKETEAEAARLVESAGHKADNVISEAREEARSLADDRIGAAREEAARIVVEAQKQAEKAQAALVDSAQNEAALLKEAASRRMTGVVQKLMAELVR